MNTLLGYTVFVISNEEHEEEYGEGYIEGDTALKIDCKCLEARTKKEAIEYALKLVRAQFEYDSQDKIWFDPETGDHYTWQIEPYFVPKENPRYAADLVRREDAIRNLKSVDLDESRALIIMPIVQKEKTK